MKLFLSSLLLCTFFNFTCSAQQGQINIIVKFNYYYLDFEKIDDPHLTTFQFNDILNSNAKKYIDELEVNIPEHCANANYSTRPARQASSPI
jgi:hypothetical protein